MIATPSPQHTPIRSALTAGTAALLCIALAACSSTSNKTAAAPGTAQTSATSRSSDTSGPATTTGPANSSAAPSSAPSSAAGNGTGASHPCALLTQAQVESAFGQPFRAGRETAIPNGGLCAFGSTDSQAHLLFTVSSWAVLSQGRNAAGASPSPVSGVGDEAFTVKQGSGAPVLFVRKASTGFYLAMTGPQFASLPDHGLAKVEALAALVLQRL